MAPRNPLNDGSQPKEQTSGKKTINRKTIKKWRLTGTDGRSFDHTVSETDTRPDVNGNYIDSETKNILFDPSGVAVPNDPSKILARSYSGLYIESPQEAALCSSWLHTNPIRIIKIGFDGQQTQNGAICDECRSKRFVFYVVLGIISSGVIFGIWHGAGLF